MPSSADSEDFKKQSGQPLPIPIQEFPKFSSILSAKNNTQLDEHKKLDSEIDEWRKSLAISVVTSIDDVLAGGPSGGGTGGGSGSGGGGGGQGLKGDKGDKGDKGEKGDPGGVLPGGFFEAAAVGNAAGVETDLLVAMLPAHTLSVDGELFLIDVIGSFGAVSSTNKRVKLKFGSVTIYDTFPLTGAENLKWHLRAVIIRTSASTQSTSVSQVGFPVQIFATSEDLDNTIIPVVLTGSGTNANDVMTVCWKGRPQL